MNAAPEFDHAFAGGRVFKIPSRGLVRTVIDLSSVTAALTLHRVWRSFTAQALVKNDVMLGLNARMVNLSPIGNVTIGERSIIRGIIRNEPKGATRIGADVYIGDNTILSSASLVEVGNWTLIAHGVQIFDNDTHPVDPDQRCLHFNIIRGITTPASVTIGNRPVVIGERAWIGMNSIIMKGVTIGDGTIVAAGSVVIDSLPAMVIASGNPATPVRGIANISSSHTREENA